MSPKKLWWLMPLLCLAACGNATNRRQYEMQKADTTIAASLDAPPPSPDVSNRKIIRSADVHGHTHNIVKAVTGIEALVRSVGGSIDESHIENTYGETKTTYYSADSLKQVRSYTATANLTLSIPSAYLDSVVRQIPSFVTMLDSRILRQTDVTNRYLSNALKSGADHQEVADNAPPPAKLELRKYEDQKIEQAIDKKIENLDLADKVQFATFTLALDQPQQFDQQVIANPDVITGTPFIIQLQSAISNGGHVIVAILLALINIWPLILLALGSWFTYKKLQKVKLASINKIKP